jgi:hypothetical protein
MTALAGSKPSGTSSRRGSRNRARESGKEVPDRWVSSAHASPLVIA